MLFGGEAVSAIQNTNVGAPRATTPSKQRAVTPTQERRADSTRQNVPIQLSRSVQQNVEHTMRHTSRRRHRRMEQDAALRLCQSNENIDETEDDGLVVEIERCPGRFSQLFDAENKFELDLFRRGWLPPPPQVVTKNSRSVNELVGAQKSWVNKVEKRLRSVVVKTLRRSTEYYDFVCSVEQLLLHFVDTRTAISQERLSLAFQTCLSSDVGVSVMNSSLVLQMKDSPLHRMLVHATCQFYGLRSKTATVASQSQAAAVKVIHINIGHHVCRVCRDRVSMAGFVLFGEGRVSKFESDTQAVEEINKFESDTEAAEEVVSPSVLPSDAAVDTPINLDNSQSELIFGSQDVCSSVLIDASPSLDSDDPEWVSVSADDADYIEVGPE